MTRLGRQAVALMKRAREEIAELDGDQTVTRLRRRAASVASLLETVSAAQVFDIIEEIPIGVSLYDEHDRLVRFNRKALEIAGPNFDAYRVGRTFEDILRDAIGVGIVNPARGRAEAYIAERMHRHRNPGEPFEFQSGDMWVQVNEHVVPGLGTIVFHIDLTEQKKVQTALERSEQRFRDYAESASDWMWETDADHRYVYHGALDQIDGAHMDYFVSPLGRTRWEIAGVADPDSDALWRDYVATLRARRPFRDFRYSMGGADGVPIQHYRVNGKPIYDEDGNFVGYRGTAAIETEAVEREKALHLRQNQLYEAVERVQVGVALYDEHDLLVSRNHVERDFGRQADVVKPGTHFLDILRAGTHGGLYPDAVGREEAFIAERYERHRNPQGPFEYRRGGGWTMVNEHRFANGSTIAVYTDITKIKEAEEALRSSEAKFRHLVQDSLQGVCIHRDLKPLFVNQAFADIFGYDTPEDILAVGSLYDLFPPDRADAMRQRAVERQAGARGVETLIQPALRRNGEQIYIQSRLGRIDWEGEPALQVTVIDVTEREMMVRLKDEFVSTVSHELRTPLTSISGALGLIASGMAGHVPPKVRELIDIANNNAERLVRLIGDLLDIQKIESGQIGGRWVVVPVPALLQAAADSNRGFAERNKIEIRVADSLPDVQVEGDMDQLMQVMTNLLSNAVKFSPPGTCIEIASALEGESVAITVTDQGPGIPPEYRDRIFDKFVQVEATDARRRGGTGLGLSISRALVEHHGGTLAYVDHEGGARFRVVLPRYRVAPAEKAAE